MSAPEVVRNYRVRYFDAAASRAGKPSIKVALFETRTVAEDFAAKNKLHAQPCRVEVIS